MKLLLQLTVLAVFTLGMTACHSNSKQNQQDKTYQRKIYLTEQDYLDDLATGAQAERREAKPNVESDYIFEVQPETDKHVYFFDDRVRPMVPDQASYRDYKNNKRLWEKPKRYSPEEYYSNQPAPTQESQSSSSSYSRSKDYYDDYDY